MKWMVGAGIAVLLILAQLIFGGKKGEDAKPAPPPAARAGRDAPGSGGDASGAADAPGEVPPPAEAVVSVALGLRDGEPSVRLEKRDGAWRIAALAGAPADADRVRLLLDALLTAAKTPLPPSAGEDGAEARGLGRDALSARLTTKDGTVHETVFGLRPEGVYDRTYVLAPGGAAVLAADLRGIAGIWENRPGAVPAADVWLERRVLRFDPGAAARLEASYPDHEIVFEKSAEGVWEALSYVPGGSWSAAGLDDWLADLAELRVGGLAEEGERFDPEQTQSHLSIDVVLADGQRKSIQVVDDHAGSGMLALALDAPGQIYRLPDWRFERYFLRMRSLFPGTAPRFGLNDIRFLDIRRGGENIKISHVGGTWRGTASAFPLRPERVERLARFLSQFRPEDYAAPDFKSVRPTYGSPMIEVTLNNFDVFQFRLAGRHPVFPWRYVLMTTPSFSVTLSVSDAEAAILFPDFADVLDLGKVFDGIAGDDLAGIELRDADGNRIAAMRGVSDGVWLIENDKKARELTPGEVDSVVRRVAAWEVVGFHVMKRNEPPKYRLEATSRDGRKKSIEVLESLEGNIPYAAAGEMGFLVDRAEFLDWVGEVADISHALDAEAEREAAEQEAARLAAEREAAEREAAQTPEPDLVAPVRPPDDESDETLDENDAENLTILAPDDDAALETAESEQGDDGLVVPRATEPESGGGGEGREDGRAKDDARPEAESAPEAVGTEDDAPKDVEPGAETPMTDSNSVLHHRLSYSNIEIA